MGRKLRKSSLHRSKEGAETKVQKSKHRDRLHSLHHPVRLLIMEYLDIKSIGRYDSACTNTKKRWGIFEGLSSFSFDTYRYSNAHSVNWVLSKGISINTFRFEVPLHLRDQAKISSWEMACKYGEVDVASLMLTHGVYDNNLADPYASDCTRPLGQKVGKRALIRAVKQNHPSIVLLCLMHSIPAPANMLHIAAAGGNVEIIHILIRNESIGGLSVDCVDDTTGCSALTVAAMSSERVNIMQTLLAYNANPNFRVNMFSDSYTPLLAAARRGFRMNVSILLDNHADIEAQDSAGCTPLILSVMAGHIACASILLEYGANPNATDENGRTALMYAVRLPGGDSGHAHDMIALLMKNKLTNPNIKCKKGQTAAKHGVHLPALSFRLLKNIQRKSP